MKSIESDWVDVEALEKNPLPSSELKYGVVDAIPFPKASFNINPRFNISSGARAPRPLLFVYT